MARVERCAGALLGFVLAAVPAGAESKPMRVLVANLETMSAGVRVDIKRVESEIALDLQARPGFAVILEDEIRALLDHTESKLALAGCATRAPCLEPLEKATRAEKILTGSLERWADGLFLTVTLSNVARSAIERSESITAADGEQLIAEVHRMLDRLLEESREKELVPELSARLAGKKVAVLDLAPQGVEPAVAAGLTHLLSNELLRAGLSVISRDEVEAMLSYELDKQMIECRRDIACLIEIGGALGVDFLVGGAVGRIGDVRAIHLKLMDVAAAEVVSRASETFRGSERQLTLGLAFAARSLIGAPPPPPAALIVTSKADGAEIAIDGGDRRPLGVPITGLTAGKHAISVRAPGFETSSEELYAGPSSPTRFDIELKPLPDAWWKKWWAWVAIGAGVAVAATTVAIIADRPETSPVRVTIGAAE